MKALAAVLLVAAPIAAMAQGIDRVALAAAEQRRCQNAILSDTRTTTAMPLAGLSIPGFCACEANLIIASIPSDQIAMAASQITRGQLPPNLRARAEYAAKYCIAAAPLTGG